MLLKKLGQPRVEPTALYYDNNSAILLANNLKFHAQTKHIDTQVHWIREIVKRGMVLLKWTPETKQILFHAFVAQAGMTQSD